jgi:hypothetical protein
MDPIEQKPRRLYPNADRSSDDINSIPKTDLGIKSQPELGGSQYPSQQNVPSQNHPLVHFSDVLQQERGTTEGVVKESSVHTFKDDLANEANKGNFSIGKVMAADNKKLHNSADDTMNIGKKDSHILAKVSVFLVCIIIIAGFSYLGFNSAKTPEDVSNQRNPTQSVAGNILYSEISKSISVEGKSRTGLFQDFSKEYSDQTPTGKIKSFILSYSATSTSLTAPEFLNIIAPSIPDIILRNIENDYVFAHYSYDSNEPFIILKSINYDSTFAGMLEWERSMYADLGDLVYKPEVKKPGSAELSGKPINSTTTANTSSSTVVSSSSASTTKVSVPTPKPISRTTTSEYDTNFVDKVISNNDARVLYRPNGEIAFFYTFFNKNTIIIAVSEQTLKEIIYRLTSGKITR